MENSSLSITLTVAQWQGLLNTLGHAPYAAVTAIGDVVNSLQAQAAEQMQALNPAPEGANDSAAPSAAE